MLFYVHKDLSLKSSFSLRTIYTGGGGGGGDGLLFSVAKKQRKTKGKKASKQQLLKGCHQGQSLTVLAVLKHLEIKNGAQKYFSVFHGPSNLKSISAALSLLLLLN